MINLVGGKGDDGTTVETSYGAISDRGDIATTHGRSAEVVVSLRRRPRR